MNLNYVTQNCILKANYMVLIWRVVKYNIHFSFIESISFKFLWLPIGANSRKFSTWVAMLKYEASIVMLELVVDDTNDLANKFYLFFTL